MVNLWITYGKSVDEPPQNKAFFPVGNTLDFWLADPDGDGSIP